MGKGDKTVKMRRRARQLKKKRRDQRKRKPARKGRN